VDLSGSKFTAYVIRVQFPNPSVPPEASPSTTSAQVEHRYSDFAKLNGLFKKHDVLLDTAFPSKSWAGRVGNWTPSLSLVTSPMCRVTLSSHDRKLAGIPEEAESYFWVFPLGKGAEMPRGEKADPLVQLLFQGGFCFCSRDDTVMSVHAISSKREDMFLQFESPQVLCKRTVDKMKKDGRFHPVTAPYLRQRGAAKFCWVMPDEIFGKVNVGGGHGAFVYLMEGQPTGLRFPVLSV